MPDWSTLGVAGPTQVMGARGIVWYEWTATVDAAGAGRGQRARTEVSP